MNRMTPKPEQTRATLSLGGNTGDVAAAFCHALEALDTHSEVRVCALSSVWRTPPWGKTDQPDFLNMAALVETLLTPQALLALCLGIERAAGRERRERWGPRPLDIDIITYGELSVTDDDLTIPHARAPERAFVLVPLAEIAPDVMINGKRADALAQASDKTGMQRDKNATVTVQAKILR